MTLTPAVQGQIVGVDPAQTIDPSQFYDNDAMVGLEDLDENDVRVPRLKIVGPEKVFLDTLTGVKYPQINTVILGVTKQRLFFAREMDEDDKPKPLCKSPDHEHGFPNVDLGLPAHKRFPWSESAFQDPAWQQPSPDPANNGHVVLPCVSCNFKEWSQDAQGKRITPPCAEQFSYALVYGGPDEEPYMPAILSLQRSAMQAAKQYNTFFVSQRKPFFTFYTKWDLDQKKRGQVVYCTPIIQRGEQTDPGRWQDWAAQARTIREFLQQVPRADDDGTEQVDGTANINLGPTQATPPQAAPPQAAPPQAAPPVQQAAPPAPAPVPEAEPVAQVAPPVQATPPVTAPETPAPQVTPAPAPVAPPTPPVAPPTPPAPVAPPVTPPAPAQAPAPAVQAAPPVAAVVENDDGLPF